MGKAEGAFPFSIFGEGDGWPHALHAARLLRCSTILKSEMTWMEKVWESLAAAMADIGQARWRMWRADHPGVDQFGRHCCVRIDVRLKLHPRYYAQELTDVY